MRLIEELLRELDEEGMTPRLRDAIMIEIADARHLQNLAKDDEERLKKAWWDAWDRGEVGKNETCVGVCKLECRASSPPKTKTTPGHYEIDLERLLSIYDPRTIIDTFGDGILEWVPEKKEMSAGSKATVALTLLEE